ncbi:MAG: TIGR01212 family radical SAM protein [Desulfomonilaceae bacterium]
MTTSRYRSLSSWLKELFSEPVRKISLDAGLGCPNRDGTIGNGGCIYCNSRGSGTDALDRGLSVQEQVDQGIEFLSRRYKVNKFIAYFQSFTNTYGDPELLQRIYSSALLRKEVVGLAIGTRPDCVQESVLELLANLSRERLVWLELGLQSSHEKTLKLIRRGHGPEVFFETANRALKAGLIVVAHTILGLPGESTEDMTLTARMIAASGIQGIKIHPLYVVAGTPLEDMFRAGKFLPMTMEQAVDATLAVLEVLPKQMVIHRLTSDPHADELVAPAWMLDRIRVRTYLNSEMESRNVFQGSKAQSAWRIW